MFINNLISNSFFLVIFIILGLWELLWKGLGLWKAGRRNEPIWFILILILNTLGILPIIYLLISKDKKKVEKK
jgi:hypothetical protein